MRCSALLLFVAAALTARDARAACEAARHGPGVSRAPPFWRTAVDDLVRATAEPGHPWSCAGGTVDLEFHEGSAVLRVARDGAPPASRVVGSPEDVVPLGKALLAQPLDAAEATPPQPVAPAPEAPPPDRVSITSEAPARARRDEPRLLLSGGIDARAAVGSGVVWLGPTVAAGVPFPRWLPVVSLRHGAPTPRRGHVEDDAVSSTQLARFPLGTTELRAGPRATLAAVRRDLDERRGDDGRLQLRVGAALALATRLGRLGHLVVQADADGVIASRGRSPADAPSTAGGRAFPVATVGGAVALEVSL